MRRKLVAGLIVAAGIAITRLPAAEAHTVNMTFHASHNDILPDGGNMFAMADGSLSVSDEEGTVCISDLQTFVVEGIADITIDGPTLGAAPPDRHVEPTAPPKTDPPGSLPRLPALARPEAGAIQVPHDPDQFGDLDPDTFGNTVVDLHTTTDGCVTAPAATLTAIQDNVGSYMIVFHTQEFPDGAIVGPLNEGSTTPATSIPVTTTTRPSDPASTSVPDPVPDAVVAVAVVATPTFTG